MNALTLTLTAAPDFDVDMSGIRPDTLQTKRPAELKRLRLALGRNAVGLGDLFEIEGDPASSTLVVRNACSRLHGLGAGMSSGELRVEGDCGLRVGAELRSGTILVRGNAGDGVASSMRGGHIEITGSVGDFLGGPMPGAVAGMKGGSVVIGRDAGARVGDRMRRGLLAIGGNAGYACGSQMIAGSIVVLGQAGSAIGSGMRRGTIALATAPTNLGANFSCAGSFDLAFIQLLTRHLATLKPAWKSRLRQVACVQRWVGDAGSGGLGEVLILE